jgi:hypothetical protein
LPQYWLLEILSCPAFPALCSPIVEEKASTRSGTITIVLCQYLLIGSAREAYIKKQGELYFGITLLMQPSDREAPSAASSEQDAATL